MSLKDMVKVLVKKANAMEETVTELSKTVASLSNKPKENPTYFINSITEEVEIFWPE